LWSFSRAEKGEKERDDETNEEEDEEAVRFETGDVNGRGGREVDETEAIKEDDDEGDDDGSTADEGSDKGDDDILEVAELEEDVVERSGFLLDHRSDEEAAGCDEIDEDADEVKEEEDEWEGARVEVDEKVGAIVEVE